MWYNAENPNGGKLSKVTCPICQSDKVQSRGIRGYKVRYQCVDKKHPEGTKRYFTAREADKEESYSPSSSYAVGDGGSSLSIVLTSRRILTEEDVISQFEVDTTKWTLVEFEVKTSEGYRKDREVRWHVENGEVTEGDVRDSGKMLVVPLFHVRAKFVRSTEQIRSVLVFDEFKKELLEEAKRTAPSYPKIKYSHSVDSEDALMYEIDMPDIHFGRLTWAEESGDDYDIKLAYHSVHKVLDELLGWVEGRPIEKILLPIGNDFFNVNSKTNTTVRGTPQQEDTRWSKTFTKGRKLAQEMIEKCVQVAPTEVLIIPGNHDEEKTFYLGELLTVKYENHPNITVDNSPKTRKYRLYGTNLVGFAHGYDEKLVKLPSLMALDEPKLWGQSEYREFHTGDKHHKFDTSENPGVVIRIIRALAAKDAWTFNNGFVGAVRAAESFLWHPSKGVVAQYTARP